MTLPCERVHHNQNELSAIPLCLYTTHLVPLSMILATELGGEGVSGYARRTMFLYPVCRLRWKDKSSLWTCSNT